MRIQSRRNAAVGKTREGYRALSIFPILEEELAFHNRSLAKEDADAVEGRS